MRVAVADDAAILREGLALLLQRAGFEVASLAANAQELYPLVERYRPHVVVTDIRMPPTFTDEGLQAARTIRQRWPGTGILVLSQYARPAYALELLSDGAGGVGYLLKERVSDLSELSAAIQRVAAGGSVLDPRVVEQLVGRPRHGADRLGKLTGREREVLALMAEGLSNKAIAERLEVTEHTVEKHVRNVVATLGLPRSDDENRRVLAVLTFLNSQ
jgi:DNA-binding NarL/FixJ family response regulator